jgi:meiotically up-regulated gene 157 (Mug157) protein
MLMEMESNFVEQQDIEIKTELAEDEDDYQSMLEDSFNDFLNHTIIHRSVSKDFDEVAEDDEISM